MEEPSTNIRLPLSQWKNAASSMKFVMDQIDKIEDTSVRNALVSINTTLFEYVKNNSNNNDKAIDDDSIEAKLQDVTGAELEDMMDEINSNSNGLPTLESGLKQTIEKAFWKPNRMSIDAYSCDNITTAPNKRKKKYKTRFADYLAIHENLIHTQLKSRLNKYIKLNKDESNCNEIDYLFKKLHFRRNVCGLFPIRAHTVVLRHWNSKYDRMIKHFESKKCETLKSFALINNGIANMFLTLIPQNSESESTKKRIGFDAYYYFGRAKAKTKTKTQTQEKVGKQQSENDSENKNNDNNNSNSNHNNNNNNNNDDNQSNKNKILADLCLSYLINQVMRTEVFVDDNTMKELLFDNDLTVLKELVLYCIQDISDGESHTKSRKEKAKYQMGIVFYIINRLTFAMFNTIHAFKLDPQENNINSNNNNSNKDGYFPSLITFFQFLYNFCLYAHLCPLKRPTRDDTDNDDLLFDKNYDNDELFYLKQFYVLQNDIYKLTTFDASLGKFNYFTSTDDNSKKNGGALYACLRNNWVTYASFLLKYGCDASHIDVETDCGSDNMKLLIKEWKQFNGIGDDEEKDSEVKTNDNETDTGDGGGGGDNEGALRMDAKSLESRYNRFTNQLVSSIYTLIGMGYDMTYYVNQFGMSKSYRNSDQFKMFSKHKTLYNLFHECNDFMLLGSLNSTTTTKTAKTTDDTCTDVKTDNDGSDENVHATNTSLDLFILSTQRLLEKKLPIIDDLVILSWLYTLIQIPNCNNKDKSKENVSYAYNKYLKLIENLVKECLQSVKTAENKHYKQRNYLWFKQYLLHSNIWLLRSIAPENNDNSILFDNCLNVVNKQLIHQKDYIWQNAQSLKKENSDEYSKLVTFGDSFKTKRKLLRQDKISNGIISDSNEFDLVVTSFKMKNSKTYQSNQAYDVMFESNTKAYLTKCLSFAHANNVRLQKAMSEYFEFDDGCKYQSAPVKLFDRCVIKCTSDYSKREFPSGACILDFLRFSVTYDNVSGLLKGMDVFIDSINNGEIKCLVPNGILRIKNGFADMNKWENVNEAQYCDIKLNIIYRDSSDSDCTCMIVEAQFLLKFLLKAKKMGHKLYSIVRQSDYIDNIKYEIYSVDNNFSKYKNKIYKLIETNDTNNLIKQIFWKPNIIFSMCNHETSSLSRETEDCTVPILYSIFHKFSSRLTESPPNHKLSLFCLNCLFHYTSIILGNACNNNINRNNSDTSKAFLDKYFNFNLGKGLYNANFFGLGRMNERTLGNPIVVEMIKLIIKDENFDAYSSRNRRQYGRGTNYEEFDLYLVLNAIRSLNYDFVKLLFDNFDKTKVLFELSISDHKYQDQCLEDLISEIVSKYEMDGDFGSISFVRKPKSDNTRCKQCLQLFFDIIVHMKIKVSAAALSKGIEKIEKIQHDDRLTLTKMMQDYAQKNKIDL